MKDACQGEIIHFNEKVSYDYIIINNQKYTSKTYRMPIEAEYIYKAQNCYVFIFKKIPHVVVYYHKRVPYTDTKGVLKYNEFDDMQLYKEKVVYYEVYNLKIPFQYTYYFDGTYIFLEFNNVCVEFEIICNGTVKMINKTLYKIFLYNDSEIIISSDKIHHTIENIIKPKYNFNLATYGSILQIKIFLTNLEERYSAMKDSIKQNITQIQDDMHKDTGLYLYELTDSIIKCKDLLLKKRSIVIGNTIICNFDLSEDCEDLPVEKKENYLKYKDMKIIFLNKYEYRT